MLITSIYNMADTYFVGTLGESAQAATGILFTVQAIMQGLAFMLGHGAGTYVSRALADRDADKATMYISTSFFTGMGLGLVIGVLGLAFLQAAGAFSGQHRHHRPPTPWTTASGYFWLRRRLSVP